jgi:hypothetical protein
MSDVLEVLLTFPCDNAFIILKILGVNRVKETSVGYLSAVTDLSQRRYRMVWSVDLGKSELF